MVFQQRRSERVSYKNFSDYSVSFTADDKTYTGLLGNISDGGMCAILPAEFPAEIGGLLKGELKYKPYSDIYPISTKIVWKANYLLKDEPKIMIGMEFAEKFVLPEYLIALSMSFEA